MMEHNSLKGAALKRYKETLKFTDIQREIIIGTLLGDAAMGLRSGKPLYSLKFEQSSDRIAFVNHLYEIFKPFVGTGPSVRKIKTNRIPYRTSVWFRTYRHDSFKFYFDCFYKIQVSPSGQKQSKKKVPKNIHKYLTARAVAYWFMDDGTYHIDQKSKVRTYLFSTQGFPKVEVQYLCDALQKNFNIQAAVNKDDNQWRISVRRTSTKALLDLVSPYIHSDFLYKIQDNPV